MSGTVSTEIDFEEYNWLDDKIYKMPCGMYVRSQMWVVDTDQTMALGTSWYSEETGNPAICMHMKKCIGCSKCIIVAYGGAIFCEAKLTDEPFDFANSVNKVVLEDDLSFYRKRDAITGGIRHCNCVHQEYGDAVVRYKLADCADCYSSYCAIRKKERNTQRVNIFYDLFTITHQGFLTFEAWTKNLKRFEHQVTRDYAEEFLKIMESKEPEKLNPRISARPPKDLLADLQRASSSPRKMKRPEIKKLREEKKRLKAERKMAREAAAKIASQYVQLGLFTK